MVRPFNVLPDIPLSFMPTSKSGAHLVATICGPGRIARGKGAPNVSKDRLLLQPRVHGIEAD